MNETELVTKEILECKDARSIIKEWKRKSKSKSNNMSGEVCGDNRFEIIENAKKYIIENTNIESSSKEMEVLDNILFRLLQLRLLEKFNPESKEFKWMGITWYKYCEDYLPPIGEEVID